jgi:signal transduction histidine kinase
MDSNGRPDSAPGDVHARGLPPEWAETQPARFNEIGVEFGSTQLDSSDSVRQMDGAWRVWESLITWDTRFAGIVDTAVAVGLFLLCSGWLFQIGPRHPQVGFVAALSAPLFFRRRAPFVVFLVISAMALVQLVTSVYLLADVSLLVALYSVAVVGRWGQVITSLVVLEIGVVAATVHWTPIESHSKSFVFLSGMACAALLTGAVVRALRGQLDWLAERAQRLELERDQQASLAAATERARIAREMHDVVSHNLQVMVTMADAASVTLSGAPERATEAMAEVADTGRQAMNDMRRMLGLLRPEDTRGTRALTMPRGHAEIDPPQPGIAEIGALVERVKSAGLPVQLEWEGESFVLCEAAELTIYRIVQEALTNVLRHAGLADAARVTLMFAQPDVSVRVTDSGSGVPTSPVQSFAPTREGHGVTNMTERAAAFGGVLRAGPASHGGWKVETTLRGCAASARV